MLFLRQAQLPDLASTSPRLGIIRNPTNDIRLRRSGSYEWYKLNPDVVFVQKDKIFSGPDSYVTLEFDQGSKLRLMPNSLISLSAGFVSLSTGTIEIETSKGEFEVESFGEVFKLDEGSSIRFENVEERKKATIIKQGPKALSSQRSLAKFEDPAPEILLLSPAEGSEIAKFDNLDLTLSWKMKGAKTDSKFKVEASSTPDFAEPILLASEASSPLKTSLQQLPAGLVHWRVTDLFTGISKTSAFTLDSNTGIELTDPPQSISFTHSPELEINFAWTNHLNLPQKLQISPTIDFSTLLVNEDNRSGQYKLSQVAEGNYFWRVGYIVDQEVRSWSSINAFEVKALAAPEPLLITGLRPILDFTLRPTHIARITDPNNCSSYEVELSSNQKVLKTWTQTKQTFELNNLADGNYQLSITGQLPDGRKVSSKVKSFKVENSPPIPAPEIKNKKGVKIFVKIFKALIDNLFPSAHAEVTPQLFYVLKWQGNSESIVELEITRPDQTIVKKEMVKGNSYKFIVDGPGTFYWRIRAKVGARWSAFSERAEIQILDKVTSLTQNLQISPSDNSVVTIEGDKREVNLAWKEPDPAYDYLVEFYRKESDQKAFITQKIKGGNLRLKLKQVPKEVYWKVTALSRYNSRSNNPQKFKIRFQHKPEVPLRFHLQPSILFSQTEFKEQYGAEADNLSNKKTFLGPAFNLSGEYFIRKSDHRRSLTFETRYGSSNQQGSTLEDTRYQAEYGFLSNPFGSKSHNFYVGYLLHSLKYKSADDFAGKYNLNFLSGRYSFIKIWSKKSLLELSGSLIVNLDQQFSPAFVLKPVYHYRFSEDWWLVMLGMYENYTAKGRVSISGDTTSAEIGIQNISVGVGISWRPN